MSYQPIALRCACGEMPERIDEVGLSASRDLVIHWWCEACRKLRCTALPLDDCLRACPLPEAEATAADVRFLARMGIRG